MQINDSKYEAVIGLEVHAQLLTETKAFCGCSTRFGNAPNSNVCPVCLGHPGVLPVLNKKVVEFTVLIGLATNCTINKHSVFARKNYFYPDLPKGYQISQYEEPICENGYLTVKLSDGTNKKIRIKRIHMEEDAGKSIHDQSEYTLIDVNRCGVPLIEIVTEPDINKPEEAYKYLTKIKQIVQYLGICDGNMEEGSLRCDANVSVRLKGEKNLGVKTEIKNMNSFRNVERALQYEIERQIELIEDGEEVIQQTLLWNADLNEAFPMRSKEEAHDYRYFPDPDLLPVIVDEPWKENIAKSMPELPDIKLQRFIQQYNLPDYDSDILTQTKAVADYYEKVVSVTDDFKSASNWIMTDVLGYLNENKIEIIQFPISAENLGKLINLISQGIISSKIAKEVFQIMLKSDDNPERIVKEKNLIQISDEGEIIKIIHEVLEKNKNQIDEYLSGKEKVFGFFVGQVMRESKGKANPQLVNQLLKSELEKYRK
ncbi:MAG: Asp-tRNA(Asn)/Glu-tRNA(Gln) amidotransferase subunit GatB [Ignavibacterium album]|uniref:Asp-tRNA(Asn)/Glu-tRNA(Gln) amidotransferase subunit GatB n=1 Tax=Ignavibacterium album TaxID=591197 RepID=UPI0026F117BC|nr:Asp-tRNA(Asn)/Glu-tRNA(Gln) amidotransferase subunit GatB [Ignavibacterium album]MCX8104633.1 Asp-tRNA(Asn)/Glu-tRNA(Gln) amidotransferase subunit GatB [Ignavibacterium album]